ncbi:FAD-dependent oxidoreductase [Paenibacillus doosanensis]|uniref:flavin monoamine oxidase family protein n=1 Tax=Paenibacillus doosanensis TaxID=1229154 RepID=UPI00217FF724|nr:NAD(P)/FAD-dependent oxidoreductase [Paenibacillus doosanensis]MCS7459867.1 FAD-dependent oxidoreductase [Paenibacillus doosanensis]
MVIGRFPERIVVIGAGMAGLVCTLELMKQGYNVRILEANSQPGGRVYTMRDQFSDGLFCEMGAAFIGAHHFLTLSYAQQVGVQLINLPVPNRSLSYIDGRLIIDSPDEPALWPVSLTAEERILGYAGMFEKYLKPGLKATGNPFLPGWPTKQAVLLDSMTMEQYLKGQGASSGAIKLFEIGYMQMLGDGIRKVSALQRLLDLKMTSSESGTRTIVGGMDQLPKKLALTIGSNISYGCAVTHIEHSNKGVTVQYNNSGEIFTINCDRVVVAIPSTVLRTIHFSPPLSKEKNDVIQNQLTTSVTRTVVQSRTRFWNNLSSFTTINTDLKIGWLIDATFAQMSSGRGLICSYSSGESAREISRTGNINSAVSEIKQVLPELSSNYEGGMVFSWDHNPYSRGAYAWYKPKQMIRMLPKLSAAQGRIYFAGDNTSLFPGWIEGAISSALRTVNQIISSNSI